jgi:hypothetical protein
MLVRVSSWPQHQPLFRRLTVRCSGHKPIECILLHAPQNPCRARSIRVESPCNPPFHLLRRPLLLHIDPLLLCHVARPCLPLVFLLIPLFILRQ